MPEKIHCQLLEIIGPDWSSVDTDQLQCILSSIQNMQLLGDEGEMFGFVATAVVDDVIGGFFGIQALTELLSYDRRREPSFERRTPFERLFFVLFPASGRLLLQSRHFKVLPIDMGVAVNRFQRALTEVLQSCRVGYVLNFGAPKTETTPQELLRLYESADRVEKFSVTNPDGQRIPDDIDYYNPERERNSILHASQVHDAQLLGRLEAEAHEGANLRDTHLVKGYIHSVRENEQFLMVATVNGEQRYVRQVAQTRFELTLEMEAKTMDPERLREVVSIVRREAGVDFDKPVVPTGQLPMAGLFHPYGEVDDDESDDTRQLL